MVLTLAGSTYTKIGTIQRRLAWPLCKDDTQIREAFRIFSCEVIGIPTLALIWNKVKRGHYGVQRAELLPGDRGNLAIQTRGGPEKHEVTGWVAGISS